MGSLCSNESKAQNQTTNNLTSTGSRPRLSKRSETTAAPGIQSHCTHPMLILTLPTRKPFPGRVRGRAPPAPGVCSPEPGSGAIWSAGTALQGHAVAAPQCARALPPSPGDSNMCPARLRQRQRPRRSSPAHTSLPPCLPARLPPRAPQLLVLAPCHLPPR